jgi:hypothetical protein
MGQSCPQVRKNKNIRIPVRKKKERFPAAGMGISECFLSDQQYADLQTA